MVAFGQSKYYSDNLSQNVKRGLRQKVRRGEFPGLAPYGYVNDANARNIVQDPTKARVIKRMFREYAKGLHNLETIRQQLYTWGVASKTGRPLAKSAVYRMLTNRAYIGLICYNGEVHEGTFKPIVKRTTFEAVQRELDKKKKPRKQKGGHHFPFTGLMRCGECGGAITAQYAKQRQYIYYRCSKRFGP